MAEAILERLDATTLSADRRVGRLDIILEAVRSQYPHLAPARSQHPDDPLLAQLNPRSGRRRVTNPRVIYLRLTNSELDALKQLATKLGSSVGEMIEESLDRHLPGSQISGRRRTPS